MAVAGWVLDALLGVLAVLAGVAVITGIVVGVPLAAFALAHRQRPQLTEEVTQRIARVLWVPAQNAAEFFEKRGVWLSAARQRIVSRASAGTPALWMVVIAPLATAVLVVATVLGAQTEMATLRATNNPVSVQWWLTFAIFSTGFVGGTMLLEGLGVTHFLAGRRTDDGAGPPVDEERGDAAEEDAPSSSRRRIRWLHRPARWNRSVVCRALVCVVAVGFLAVPLYAVSTGATKRAEASVNAQLLAMAGRGVTCSSDGVSIGVPPSGGPPMAEAAAVNQCATIAATREQNRGWGLAGAIGMVALDVALGWSVLVTVALLLAASVAGVEGLAALGRGAARFVARTVDRLHQLFVVAVRLVEELLPRDGAPQVDLRDTPGAPEPGGGDSEFVGARGGAPPQGSQPPPYAGPSPNGGTTPGATATWDVPPESRTNGTGPHQPDSGPADPADVWA